ncbi:hypothetical protein ACTJKN_22425 [Pedobacter sp. 22163]|uniref:hypothetical protein n=1 Tax=Pedobacter sp. 22163 TaxID=3453883 RepID=UPI003F827741
MKSILLSIVAFFLSFSGFCSVVGCSVPSAILRDQIGGGQNWEFDLNIVCSTGTASYANISTTPVSSGGTCKRQGGENGTLVYYDMANCPIDDYIWCLILPLAAFSYFYIRINGLYLKIV